MRVVLCLTLLFYGTVNCGFIAAPPATLVRAPKYDSAIIQSDRLGGNFAYSTAQSHAYAIISPIIEHVVKPVAVTYTAHQVVPPVVVSPVLSTTVIHTPPIDYSVASLPQIVSNVVESIETPAYSSPETPADEVSASDAPAQPEDSVQVEST
ncbi:hypothetical protein L9F63_013801 [Diploptera punctata]|uniref:Uncharacterized protein n=1 Tax=Diploptera punctata TaxID=6984 RepID=A0AAD8AAW0_DIPPU|nr:hypothetical protein L9F63_013801 [Diploptera punctata]